jgi:hypothetical protein
MRNSFVFFIREASSLDVSLLHTRIDANGGLATSLWGTAPVAGKRTAFWVLFLVTQAESYTGRDLPPRAVPRSARAPAERGSTIPKRLGRTQEMLRHFIEFAAKMMEWAALSEAVEVMIRQQREFCEWWTGAVHHKGGERWLDNQDRCYQGIPMRQAESETGISQQREFCQWWSEHVTPGLRMGSNQWVVAERGPTTSAAQAEQDTGVTKQQVSRWSHALANEDAYRFAITDAACRKAGIEPARKSSCRQVNTF